MANPISSQRWYGRVDRPAGVERSSRGIAILQIDRSKLDLSLIHSDRNHDKDVYGGHSFEYHGVIPPKALSVYYTDAAQLSEAGHFDPSGLIPGKIDGDALRIFKHGGCGALAIAIHDTTGWPIVAITDAHNVSDGQAGGGSALHWTIQHPSGKLLDIDGLHEPQELVNEYTRPTTAKQQQVSRHAQMPWNGIRLGLDQLSR